jgi:ankyrin repeat protein
MTSSNALFIKAVKAILLFGFLLGFQFGCGPLSLNESTWHRRLKWRAEDYFSDPKVIDLCRAIEVNDLPKMDRLIAAGANVNEQGKGNMTPLLWAFPDNKLERFKRLLDHGADPNVIFQSDFGTAGQISPGESITHLACDTNFPGYFEAVFDHGGNPNLVSTAALKPDDTPLFTVIKGSSSDKPEKIQLLVAKGADLNHMNGTWATPTIQAVSWGGQYDIALLLLKKGADFRKCEPETTFRLVHVVLREQRRKLSWTGEQAHDYQQLVSWLEDHGETLEEARADEARWAKWPIADFKANMKAEAESRKLKQGAPEKAK